MREILFKAKRIDNGEWVQGRNILTLIPNQSEELEVYIAQSGAGYSVDIDEAGNLLLIKGELYKVDPETVCQYTGLTDKNGTQIFEGDIVKDKYIFGKVVYNTNQEDFDGAASFMIDDVDDGLQSYRFWNIIEVIGNIFDNTELWKAVQYESN